jgi:hypothetical protein
MVADATPSLGHFMVLFSQVTLAAGDPGMASASPGSQGHPGGPTLLLAGSRLDPMAFGPADSSQLRAHRSGLVTAVG